MSDHPFDILVVYDRIPPNMRNLTRTTRSRRNTFTPSREEGRGRSFQLAA
ncbi:MAG: hypothetical protein GYA12_14200 [Chloroflexi bacterium]|nr:hypothetical protein [Chloroflexota bacterium]